MMKTIRLAAAAVILSAAPAFASEVLEIKAHDWSFQGPFGRYDQAELQRGFQVYNTVCKACHGLKFVSFRDLMAYDKETGLGNAEGPRFSEEQAKAIAASYDVPDAEGEPGATRPGKLFDRFPVPQSIGNPPDLSLIAKAREAGPAHVYSILTGFTGEEKTQAGATLYENKAFPGHWIGMAPPLSDDLVEYADGSPKTLNQYAHDVSAFLMWAAEPKMVERKSAGVRNVLFLILLASMMWFVNKKVWHKVKHPEA